MTQKCKQNRIKCGSSETLRAVCSKQISNINIKTRRAHKSPQFFSHWLAGLIDGDGSLLVSKQGYSSCEITVAEREWKILETVKSRLGGSIKPRTGVRALRWRMHNRGGMRQLIELINGKLCLPEKEEQLKKVCHVLQLQPLLGARPQPNNGWCAGFFEAEGYLHINSSTLQCSITLSQKKVEILERIACHFPAPIYHDKGWDGWLYAASSKESLFFWVKYFSRFPLISWKQIQLHRFKRVLLYKDRGVHRLGTGRPLQRFQRLLKEFAGVAAGGKEYVDYNLIESDESEQKDKVQTVK